MRILKYAVLAVVVVLVAGLSAVILTDRMNQPAEPDPQIFIARAAHYHARIVRDNFGVPHIFGHRDADVAFGLGFAHSEDDFATIQNVVLATRGTLAASEGIVAPKTDCVSPLVHFGKAVKAGYATLPATVRAVC